MTKSILETHFPVEMFEESNKLEKSFCGCLVCKSEEKPQDLSWDWISEITQETLDLASQESCKNKLSSMGHGIEFPEPGMG